MSTNDTSAKKTHMDNMDTDHTGTLTSVSKNKRKNQSNTMAHKTSISHLAPDQPLPFRYEIPCKGK